MNIAETSLEEIRCRGVQALVHELGPAGMIRFLQQFQVGKGDYTRDRHQWLPDNLQEIAEEIERQSKSTQAPEGGIG